MSDKSPLACHGLIKRFDEGADELQVLNGVDLNVAPGERLAIIGESGAGKTTLLQLLGGLDAPTEGCVTVFGQDLAMLNGRERGELRNRTLGFVYQFHHLLPEFSALENVAMPLLLRRESLAEVRERAARLLERVGLGERLTHRPGELSGGERQRVAVARALVTEPAVVLADEPTGNLDPKTADLVFNALTSIVRQSNLAALIATHNIALARRMDRTITLRDGKIVAADIQ